MSNTLHQYATEMIRKVPGDLWREDAITSLTTTTIVSNSLLFGGISNDRYAGQWAWRPDTTTTADKTRYITAFASATGTLTHAGANFSDTTATGENVIISRVEPYIVRQAIDSAVRRLKTVDRTEFPFVSGQGWYSLGEATWIRQPSDIVRICYDHSPQITRNRYLQKRNSVNTSGLPVPDFWTVTSNASTAPFVDTNYRGQKTYYELKRSGGTDAILEQSVSSMLSGVSTDFPIGEDVTAVVVCHPDTAGDVQLFLDAGGANSSTGSGSARQEITVTATLTSAATDVVIDVMAQTSNAAQPIYEAYAFIGSELTDAVRRDNFPEYELDRGDWDFDQNGVLTIRMPQIGRGRFIVYSKRAYPGFDNTRLISGAADADSSDAPLDAVCAGALSRIYFGLEGGQSPNYLYWENQFSQLSRRHLYGYANTMNFVTGGPVMPAPRRVR
jgi:hypothetical protein